MSDTPSGFDIARWFADQMPGFHNDGGDGTLLSEDPLCSLWHLATVDHDDQEFYLLDVCTDGSSDLLFVTAGQRVELACEWRNVPSRTQSWGYEAIVWFAGLIEEYEDGWNATDGGSS